MHRLRVRSGVLFIVTTLFETRSKFKAIAIFSGAPDMGKKYATGVLTQNFGEVQKIKSIMNVPVFIVHDEKDMNVPIAATRDLMEKLASVGAHMAARIKPDKGCESPGMEGIEAFKKWAMEIVNGRGL